MKVGYSVTLFLLLAIGLISNAQNKDSALFKYVKYPIGASIGHSELVSNQYQRFFISQFNSMTPENCMKMKYLVPKKGIYQWAHADTLVTFCTKNNIRIHGHALVWHQSVPNWITDALDSAQLEQILKDHIETTVGRYKGKVKSWDVVNEVFQDFSDTLRQSIWLRKLGKDFIGRAFIYAHNTDPNAKLFYNDFLIEASPSKNRGLIQLLDEFKKNNIPIHGVGFQMHTNVLWPDSAIMVTHIQEVVKKGYLIHFSELDVDNNNRFGIVYSDSFAIALSKRYRTIASIYTQIPKSQQYGITFWNVTDADSWIRGYFKRSNEWPLLFDEQFQKKKAYFGFVEGLKAIKK